MARSSRRFTHGTSPIPKRFLFLQEGARSQTGLFCAARIDRRTVSPLRSRRLGGSGSEEGPASELLDIEAGLRLCRRSIPCCRFWAIPLLAYPRIQRTGLARIQTIRPVARIDRAARNQGGDPVQSRTAPGSVERVASRAKARARRSAHRKPTGDGTL